MRSYELDFKVDTITGRYILLKPIRYLSPRYGRTMTVPVGFVSDGATGAPDILTRGWWVHDLACERRKWDDGSAISLEQASRLLHDCLREDGFWWRCWTWWFAVYVYGKFTGTWE